MKILHIAPNAPYNDYWGYQDNLLPKYHRKLGHDVTIIVTNTMHQDGRIVDTDCADYVLNDGVRVIRLKKRVYPHRALTNLSSRLNVLPYLNEIRPDFVFFHGLVSTTIFDVIQYKKENPECVVVQDNHLDYNIGRCCKNWKDWIIRWFYRQINKKSIPYVNRVYGVTPWRKQYAEEYFGIPSEKTDVLIMGADDEKIDLSNREQIRAKIRSWYQISEKDFLIVTGGKIDKKKKIDVLMRACEKINGVKLLIFGNVTPELKTEFEQILSENKNIIYIGWIASDAVYDYFFAADVVFFPGQHSVLWEQACASKVPCVFEKWDGMEHVNNGGNSDFVSPITMESIREKICQLYYTDEYCKMKTAAESKKTDIFLYSCIAERTLKDFNLMR